MGALQPQPTLSQQLADHLGQQIIRGQRAPGERLPEQDLAQQLDVSTNSLREAFRLLERRHLVEHQPRRGARVRPITPGEVEDLYGFLFLLLGHLASRAAIHWQTGELDELVGLLPELEGHHRNNDIAQGHEVAFEVIQRGLKFADNRYLRSNIEDLMPLLQRYSFIALQEQTSEFDVSLAIFQRLMTNLGQRNAEAAAADIRDYGANQCDIVLQALSQRDSG